MIVKLSTQKKREGDTSSLIIMMMIRRCGSIIVKGDRRTRQKRNLCNPSDRKFYYTLFRWWWWWCNWVLIRCNTIPVHIVSAFLNPCLTLPKNFFFFYFDRLTRHFLPIFCRLYWNTFLKFRAPKGRTITNSFPIFETKQKIECHLNNKICCSCFCIRRERENEDTRQMGQLYRLR